MRFIFAPIDSEAAEMVRQGRERIGFTERAIGATRLPYLMVAFQAMNLGQSGAALSTGLKAKKVLGIFAAGLDLTLATLNLSDYLSRRYEVLRPVVHTSNISQKVVIKNGQANIFSRMFPRLITVNWLFSRGAGLLAWISHSTSASTALRL